jgi:hypothetical protein
MRLNAILVLLTVLFISNSASAQVGRGPTDCERELKLVCWAQFYGRCAHPNPRIAIPACTRQLSSATAVLPGLADELLASIFPCPLAQRVLQPGIKAARLDAQAPAHRPHREQRAMIGNERVLHFASLAKYAVAFLGCHAPR